MNWHIFTDDELTALHDHYHARRDYARAATCVVFGAAIIALIGADWRIALGLWVATLIPSGIAGRAARRDYARAATCVVFGAAIIALIGADWRIALGLWVATLIPSGIAGRAARRHDDINGERGHRRLLDLLGVQRTRHVDDPACVCDACLYRRMRQTS